MPALDSITFDSLDNSIATRDSTGIQHQSKASDNLPDLGHLVIINDRHVAARANAPTGQSALENAERD